MALRPVEGPGQLKSLDVHLGHPRALEPVKALGLSRALKPLKALGPIGDLGSLKRALGPLKALWPVEGPGAAECTWACREPSGRLRHRGISKALGPLKAQGSVQGPRAA
ncbi:hypothetical protein L1887_32315 [Cichorium endivia]|nr:hypothetical protein L1887_32315 [Cichorium endivia]